VAGRRYVLPTDRHKLNIIDEGWSALEDLAVVRYLQDQWRLGRQWGVANILITHALADLHSQTDDGTAQTKITEGLLNTTSVRVFLHQNPNTSWPAQRHGTQPVPGQPPRPPRPLPSPLADRRHTALIDHVISDREWTFADTDTACAAIDLVWGARHLGTAWTS